MNSDGETFCEVCEKYRPRFDVHREEIEGEHLNICEDCLQDNDRIVDCEHALIEAYDHLIWKENAVDAGDNEFVCHAELMARLEASEIIG